MSTIINIRNQFHAALLEGNPGQVTALLRRAVAEAGPVATCTQVVEPCLARIGRAWQAGRVSIAQEHRATALLLDALGQMRPSPLLEAARGLGVVACVEGNHHEVGARMLADVLLARQWRVDYLGADTPPQAIVAHSQQTSATLVALSAALPDHLSAAATTTAGLKSLPQPPRVMLGGLAVKQAPRQARAVGADIVAASLEEGLQELTAARQAATSSLAAVLEGLGRRIHTLRLERKWSQARLAEAAGLDRAYLSAVERGKQNVSLGAVLRIAQALEVTLDQLLLGAVLPRDAW